MTPSMRLSDLIRHYLNHPDGKIIKADLDEAFSLGHEFGLERAADTVDQCNREGPYNAIGAASRIRALKVVRVQPIAEMTEDFLP